MNGLLLFFAEASPRVLGGFRWPMLAAGIALAVSWFLTPWVRQLAINKGAIDDPNRDDRRIHKEPLPRWGGLAIYAGIVLATLVVMPLSGLTQPFPAYLVGLLGIGGLLVVVGALDDLYQYAAKVQLVLLLAAGVLIQFSWAGSPAEARIQIATISVPFTGGAQYWSLGLFAIPITSIYIFVVTKTMDTIDGVDGLASGISSIAAATLTVIAVYCKQPQIALLTASVAGASIGFLKHNYNPAKIIMGTGGAYILGFTLACLSIVGALKTAAAVALVVPILVFGVPIFDAFFVITRRILSGVPITQADKRHVHHTLLRKGLNQRQTVLVLYSVAAILGVAAILVIKQRQ